MLEQATTDVCVDTDGGGDFAPFETVPGDVRSGLLLICDHADNRLPERYGTLGLEPATLERHIAYDPGVAEVTRALAQRIDAPAVLSTYSRLLIDPNRGQDDPTLVMKVSDGALVPGNRLVDAEEVAHRTTKYYAPYHAEIDRLIDQAISHDKVPAILSIHSFTPHWRGAGRQWHAGVLWDKDGRLARGLIEELERRGDLIIGDNAPYSGRLKGDCLYRHGTMRGIAHALLEIRQDLIADMPGIDGWVDRLAQVLGKLLETGSDLHEVKLFGSHSDT